MRGEVAHRYVDSPDGALDDVAGEDGERFVGCVTVERERISCA